MITKEKLKQEIDKLPSDKLDTAYKLLKALENKKNKKNKINLLSHHLQGQYDKIDIRKASYE